MNCDKAKIKEKIKNKGKKPCGCKPGENCKCKKGGGRCTC